MNCKICKNFENEECKFCSFEFDEDLPWTNDEKWDIFNINDNIEWSYLQIMYRLKSKGIDCLQVLDWYDNNAIVIIGCNAFNSRVADALGVHEECMVSDEDVGIKVVNLFKELYLRGDLE